MTSDQSEAEIDQSHSRPVAGLASSSEQQVSSHVPQATPNGGKHILCQFSLGKPNYGSILHPPNNIISLMDFMLDSPDRLQEHEH